MIDWWGLVVAIASVAASCVIAGIGARLQKALIESQVYEHIAKARLEFEDLVSVVRHSAGTGDAAARYDTWLARLEAFLKALDDACSKYLARKVGARWFERQYKRLILQLMRSPIGVEVCANHRDDYMDLWETYKRWNNAG